MRKRIAQLETPKKTQPEALNNRRDDRQRTYGAARRRHNQQKRGPHRVLPPRSLLGARLVIFQTWNRSAVARYLPEA